ncbi:MAG: DUF952 domain-containing protein [Candidatus Dormibacteraeota bacterium]|nr:DUF952 domain-containing protein [Candidatus Dormibacteraeota bacterium]
MAPIFHVTAAAEWAAALARGEYRGSTRGKSLDEVGFVHCSDAAQVARVAGLVYPGMRGLVLLAIDPQRLGSPLRREAVTPGGERFPHIYGPLEVEAVISVTAYEPGPDGVYPDLVPPGAG